MAEFFKLLLSLLSIGLLPWFLLDGGHCFARVTLMGVPLVATVGVTILLVFLVLAVGVVVVIEAVVALAKALALLVLRVGPQGDEVAEFFEVTGPLLGELAILIKIVEALVESLDDLVIRELDAGGLLFPKAAVVVLQAFIRPLLAGGDASMVTTK